MRTILIFLFCVSFAVSQDVKVDTLENVERHFLENVEVDSDVDEVVEQIEFLRIELNKATIEDLTEVPFITRDIAIRIISYRDTIGGFKTREQVFDIPGVDEPVKVFLYRNGYIHKPSLSFQMRTRALDRGNLKSIGENFEENFKTYHLTRLTFSNFSGGFLIEKDYGEKKINDLTRFYVEYKSSGFFRKFVLGSYTVMFGQGILMWRPVALGKGSDAISPVIRSSENHISGYISTDEVKPLFGSAVNSRFKSFELTLFYSTSKLPSSVDTIGFVRYIDFSGINTTPRFSLSRNLFGGILSFGKADFSIGIMTYYEKFGARFSPSISRPFGKGKFYHGVEYSVYFRNLNFSGEVASSHLRSFSIVSGLGIYFKDVEMVFQYRNLNPDFTSINGNTFGERYAEAWNEEGFYSGIRFRIGILKFSGYCDIFRFPRSNFDDVRGGIDYRIEMSLRVSRNVELRLLRRDKSSVKGTRIYDEFGRNVLIESIEKVQRWRFEAENSFQKIKFRSRVEFVERKLNDVETGFLIYQGAGLTLFKSLKFYARILFFRSDSYWSRLYVYEDDLDGVVSLIPLYGEGFRWYFVVKYNYGKNFSLQLKYGETFFADNKLVRNIFGVQIEFKI